MHTEAYNYVFAGFHTWRKDKENLHVLEIGSLDINGSVRPIFKPFAEKYIGIDIQEGPGVDIVATGDSYWSPNTFDVVVCAEVFEHTNKWKDIIKQSWINLKQDGLFIATMAGEGRPFHSGIDGGQLKEWEHYANIGAWELNQALFMFQLKEVNYLNADLRCWAIK
ncbi:MAG: methyltransferase domain-containing protein [Caulobacteraceae bacterium]|nr:methyltransferase domain-containing protein [Caulobacteraceae bacterium]